ncbi:ImmA/IrrE family metallo-endopeptidase [Leuconostoc citreum]|nr:ImmA/IrrE family metallo-endopeptidase [Leuconostoc citreum]
MNTNYETNVSFNFRLAHELSHLLYGDKDIQKIYTFSEFGHRYEELQAHRNAIRMLMSIEMPSSSLTFMSYYRVPAWLENDVTQTYNELEIEE